MNIRKLIAAEIVLMLLAVGCQPQAKPGTSTRDTTADWKVYTNTEYGFQLTFTDAWQGYVAVEENTTNGVGIYFEMPTSDPNYFNKFDKGYASPLGIAIYSKAEWARILQAIKNGAPDISSGVLAENKQYVFTYFNWQDGPNDLMRRNFEFGKVISSFRLVSH